VAVRIIPTFSRGCTVSFTEDKRVRFFFTMQTIIETYMVAIECITVRPTQTLKSVLREYRSRKVGCYVLHDKYHEYLIVTQKLNQLSSFIASIAVDKASCVSVTTLFENIESATSNRVGGYSKHRWRLTFEPLENVAVLFETERARYKHTLIFGPRACYRLECNTESLPTALHT